MRVSRERATLWGLLVVTSLCLGSGAAWAEAPPFPHDELWRLAGRAASIFPPRTDGAGGEQTAQAPLEPDVSLTEAERAEASKLLPLMNDAMRDQPVPSDISVDLGYDFLKAQPGQVYVPFTLKLDPATVSQSITLYIRLAPAGMMLPPPPPEPEPGAPPAQPPAVEPPSFPFEDVHFIDMPIAADVYIVRRAFAVAAGSYDLYLGIKDSELVETDSIEVRRAVVKRTVEVPDLWGGQLTTSSVIVTDHVESIPVPLSAEQQRTDPYAIGSTRIVPRDVLQYETTDTLSFLFFIYNPQLIENKPDVTVEYSFHQVTGDGEQFFNATSPQTLNAETLPPQFDMSMGHQLSAGQHVPLSAFPEGTYRLEIKVTDNTASASILRNVGFTVIAS